jgi:ATP-dependent DNA helicase RecQ
MLKVLDVEGAVARDGTRWLIVPDSTWTYDGERYARVTELRRAEQRAMASFGADRRCLMRTLQEQLDDPSPSDCGRCAVCSAPRFAEPLDTRLVEMAGRHLRSRPIELEVKKMAPDASGAMRKLPEERRTDPGWALARFGDGGWWPAVQRGLDAGGAFEDDLVGAVADLARSESAAWVCAVPSVRLGDALDRLAGQVAATLGVPAISLLTRAVTRPPQREMANAVQQAANVRGAFQVVGRPPAGTGILLDDRRISGWTLAMVGGQLRMAGAQRVVPLALATLV